MTRRIDKRLQVILCLAIALLGLQAVVFPALDRQDEIRDRVFLLQKKLTRLKNLEANRGRLENTLAEGSRRLDALSTMFNTDTQSSESLQLVFQKELEQIASQNGIQVRNMEWLHVNESEIIVQTPIRMTFQSSLEEFYNFIYELEHHKLLFSVDIFQLVKTQDGHLVATVELSAFSLKGWKGKKPEGEREES